MDYRPQCAVMHSRANASMSGNCDIDIDECLSHPCANSASCSDSTSQMSVLVDAFSCSCMAGFANGMCNYSSIPQYASQCRVVFGGRCDIDVNECTSTPCRNAARCFDSSSNASVSVNAYSCVCMPGFTNGVCAYGHIIEVTAQCSIYEGGNCDVDVDECASSPCQNGASCVHSTSAGSVSHHAYQCLCSAGFANGNCSYANIAVYDSICAVAENGNCDVDVDE
jgi:hypothetical protein